MCNYAIMSVMFLSGVGARYEQIIANTVTNLVGTVIACVLGLFWATFLLQCIPKDPKNHQPDLVHFAIDDHWSAVEREDGRPRLIQTIQLPNYQLHLWLFVTMFLGSLFLLELAKEFRFGRRYRKPIAVVISAWTMILFGTVQRHYADDHALLHGHEKNRKLRQLYEHTKKLKISKPANPAEENNTGTNNSPPRTLRGLRPQAVGGAAPGAANQNIGSTSSPLAQPTSSPGGGSSSGTSMSYRDYLKEHESLDLKALIIDVQTNLDKVGQEHASSMYVSVLRRSAGVALGVLAGVLFSLLLPYVFPRHLKLRKVREDMLQNTRDAVRESFLLLLQGFRKYRKEQEYRQKLLDGIYLGRPAAPAIAIADGDLKSKTSKNNGEAGCDTREKMSEEQEQQPRGASGKITPFSLETMIEDGANDETVHIKMNEEEQGQDLRVRTLFPNTTEVSASTTRAGEVTSAAPVGRDEDLSVEDILSPPCNVDINAGSGGQDEEKNANATADDRTLSSGLPVDLQSQQRVASVAFYEHFESEKPEHAPLLGTPQRPTTAAASPGYLNSTDDIVNGANDGPGSAQRSHRLQFVSATNKDQRLSLLGQGQDEGDEGQAREEPLPSTMNVQHAAGAQFTVAARKSKSSFDEHQYPHPDIKLLDNGTSTGVHPEEDAGRLTLIPALDDFQTRRKR
eukprot:GSA120T00011334001.1